MWDVKVIENLIGDFFVSICLKMDNLKEWWFSGIYDPPSASSRRKFWDELMGLCEICGGNWCLRGDFNVVRNSGKKK